MKRIQYHRYGDATEMRLENTETPTPGKGEVRVRVKATPVNPVDWKIRNGDLKLMTGRRFPKGMGIDFSGVVDAAAPDSRFKPGSAVIGALPLQHAGAFAEMVIVKEAALVHKPESLSFEQAATLPTAAVAAWMALNEKSRLQPGQQIFISGCLGGVGRIATQIAIANGLRVFGNCAANAIREAEKLGIQKAFDYRAGLTPLAGLSFDAIFDTAGKLDPAEAYPLLNRNGVFLDLNATPTKMIKGMFNRRYRMLMINQRPDRLEALARLAAQGQITSTIGTVVPLQQAIAAITALEQLGQPKGRLIIST